MAAELPFRKGETVRLLRSGETLTVESCYRDEAGAIHVITNNPWGTAQWFECLSTAVGKP
jgi:hypothetical protein